MATHDLGIHIVATPAELDALEPLWIALHRHHRTVVPSPELLVDDDSVSWSRRRALYRGWMASGDALVLIARRGGAPIGYAVAHLQDGPDDTFAVGARYAELYSLSVAPEARGLGVGTALMDTLDERLAALGITDLSIAVMAGNEDALRFYRRRGLVPVELVLRTGVRSRVKGTS
jgi:ribosomal protein S18 acetylase RimI-like enzyme